MNKAILVLDKDDKAPAYQAHRPVTLSDGRRSFTALEYSYLKYAAYRLNGRRASLYPCGGIVYITFGAQLYETVEAAAAFLRAERTKDVTL